MAPTTPVTTVAPAPATAPAAPIARRLSRRADITVRTLQIVLALFLAIPSAGPKLVGHAFAAESFDRIGFGDWFMYLVGALELAGAVALVIPVLSGVSALALIGLMAGAFITQMTVFDGQNALTPLIIAVPLAVIARTRRHHNAQLVALMTRGRA
ncbi:DoxX family protein [Streptomyces sp. SP18CS02]|uniref:DoxX family protein n=1 Tax=Streptomyces sp. SP18CS02 TaxID=3002531 RepID=UPI002E770352|nr:DoxX family protein [Streptomyces sp. SP18CS02]MEE1754960.1 DoxX family protein [Streptomyces sp. SP18CS02]